MERSLNGSCIYDFRPDTNGIQYPKLDTISGDLYSQIRIDLSDQFLRFTLGFFYVNLISIPKP